MPNRLFFILSYIMNINIYNLFYICTLVWVLFLRINLFVFVILKYQGVSVHQIYPKPLPIEPCNSHIVHVLPR